MSEQTVTPWLVPFKGIELDSIGQLSQYVNLPDDHLLHAGPPYGGVSEIPQPVLNAAAQILIVDGKTESLDHALYLIRSSHFKLKAAQSYGVVTPLAQVVSAHSWVFKVSDGQETAYSPLVESAPPAVRFGSSSLASRDALRALKSIAIELNHCLPQGGLPIAPLIAAGLKGGDDCHAVTAATHTAFLNALRQPPESLLTHYGFVLPIIMAASAVALRRAGTIRAIGCNGVNIGWQSASEPIWHQQEAAIPVGETFSTETTSVLRAIGDSAVIDFAGLGAQALAWSPQMSRIWQDYLPHMTAHKRARLIDPKTGLVCIRPVVLHGTAPRIHLAMVDACGAGNILGRGVVEVDPDLFSDCAPADCAPAAS
jgi:hypothetical protein